MQTYFIDFSPGVRLRRGYAQNEAQRRSDEEDTGVLKREPDTILTNTRVESQHRERHRAALPSSQRTGLNLSDVLFCSFPDKDYKDAYYTVTVMSTEKLMIIRDLEITNNYQRREDMNMYFKLYIAKAVFRTENLVVQIRDELTQKYVFLHYDKQSIVELWYKVFMVIQDGVVEMHENRHNGTQESEHEVSSKTSIQSSPHPSCSEDRLYPFLVASAIEMRDVTEDGMPPDERARPPSLHLNVDVTICDGNHFPKMDSLPHEKCDPLCSITFNDVKYKTHVKNNTYDCSWNETFTFFVHSIQATSALMAMGTESIGPAFTLQCFDWNLIGGLDFIGGCIIPLRDVLNGALRDEGTLISVRIQDLYGADVVGFDGMHTTLTLKFRARKKYEMIQMWRPPTLQDTLECSEGIIKLGKSFRVAKSSILRTQNSGFARASVSPIEEETSILEVFDQENSSLELDTYWREKLAEWMESLTVNIFVMSLVVLDLMSLIFFQLVYPVQDGEPDPIAQVALTVFVLSCFVIELSLRMVAQRHRSQCQLLVLGATRHIAMIFTLSLGFACIASPIAECPFRFLSLHHYGSFFVFNLCDTYISSDGVIGNYHPQMLFNQVQRIPFEDHAPPLMSEMVQFCEEASSWLQAHPNNTIVVHCKGGKGRTGLMIAALLLWTGHRRCAVDAMELFTFRRTHNYDPEAGFGDAEEHDEASAPRIMSLFQRKVGNQGPEGPSQIRYVHYVEAMLYSGIDPLNLKEVMLTQIAMPVMQRHMKRPWYLSFSVRCMRYVVYDSGRSRKDAHVIGNTLGELITIPANVIIWGDTRIDFYFHKQGTSTSELNRKLAFFLVFNTAFYPETKKLIFRKNKIDLMQKMKNIENDFRVELHLEPNLENHELTGIENSFYKSFLNGKRVQFKQGECVLSEQDVELVEVTCLLQLTRGSVQGIIQEVHDPSHTYHPLGSNVPNKDSTAQNSTRKPCLTMLGTNSILGSSQFLRGLGSMEYRARCDVEVLILERKGSDASGKMGRYLDDSTEALSPRPSRSYLATYEDRFDSRRGASMDAVRTQISVSDIAIQGLPNEDLFRFYQGLALKLSHQLSRTRIEMIRHSGLKAFNDRQSVMYLDDELEKLRMHLISYFGIPVNDKILLASKCMCLQKDTSGKVSTKKLRIILLSNSIIFDREVFGPYVSATAEQIRIDQLLSVFYKSEGVHNTVTLQIQGERIQGLELLANLREMDLTFHGEHRLQQIYSLLLNLCKKGNEVRDRQREKPFERPHMTKIFEKCAKVHQLRKGQVLKEGSTTDSLFVIRTGSIKLTRDGSVFRRILEGWCFGSTEFVEQTVSGRFVATATERSTILELPPIAVQEMIARDHALGANFFWTLCQVMEDDIREGMEEMFPGTWSLKVDSQHITSNLTLAATSPAHQEQALKRLRVDDLASVQQDSSDLQQTSTLNGKDENG
eukprot:648446-Hanusia_phi.AAC.3